MFRRKSKAIPALGDKIASPLTKVFGKAQYVFGTKLNRWSGKWTRRQQLVFLWSFGACMMGVIFLQLYHKESQPPQLPAHTHVPTIIPLDNGGSQPKINAKDTLIIQLFHARIRQMQSTPQGRDSLREFIKQRPGFIDSVIAWEQSIKRNIIEHGAK
jgi:hypothetical protein